MEGWRYSPNLGVGLSALAQMGGLSRYACLHACIEHVCLRALGLASMMCLINIDVGCLSPVRSWTSRAGRGGSSGEALLRLCLLEASSILG